MTNLEVIKLMAEKRPGLLAEVLDDIYCVGFNDGNASAFNEEYEEHLPDITEEWLNSEYDKDIFRESDIELLQSL